VEGGIGVGSGADERDCGVSGEEGGLDDLLADVAGGAGDDDGGKRGGEGSGEGQEGEEEEQEEHAGERRSWGRGEKENVSSVWEK